MSKKQEVFGQFPPEPGSKDAETAWVEGEEKFQESLGVERDTDLKEGDQNETPEEIEQRHEQYRRIYLNRRRTENDTRSDEEILAELQNLLKNWNDTELWKKTSPSFAELLEKRPAADDPNPVHNTKIRWLNGLDLNDK